MILPRGYSAFDRGPGEQNILWFDIAVDDAVTVGAVERIGDFGGKAHSLVDWQLPLAVEPRAERFPFDEWHGEPEDIPRSTRVEHRQDMGMLQARSQSNFSLESLWPKDGRQVRAQYLQRYLAVMPQIMCEVDRRHASTAELTLERVAIVQGIRKRGGRVQPSGTGLRGWLEFAKPVLIPLASSRQHGRY
jgi:hypothetical protein